MIVKMVNYSHVQGRFIDLVKPQHTVFAVKCSGYVLEGFIVVLTGWSCEKMIKVPVIMKWQSLVQSVIKLIADFARFLRQQLLLFDMIYLWHVFIFVTTKPGLIRILYYQMSTVTQQFCTMQLLLLSFALEVVYLFPAVLN